MAGWFGRVRASSLLRCCEGSKTCPSRRQGSSLRVSSQVRPTLLSLPLCHSRKAITRPTTTGRTAIGHDAQGRLMLVQIDGRSWIQGINLYTFAGELTDSPMKDEEENSPVSSLFFRPLLSPYRSFILLRSSSPSLLLMIWIIALSAELVLTLLPHAFHHYFPFPFRPPDHVGDGECGESGRRRQHDHGRRQDVSFPPLPLFTPNRTHLVLLHSLQCRQRSHKPLSWCRGRRVPVPQGCNIRNVSRAEVRYLESITTPPPLLLPRFVLSLLVAVVRCLTVS